MKKSLCSLFLTTLILVSCSKSADDSLSIVGTWQTNKIISKLYINSELKGIDTSLSGSLILTSDKNFISVDESGDSAKGIYVYDAGLKRLTAISNGDSQMLTVTKLTANNLHLTGDQTDIYDGDIYRSTLDADYQK